MFVIVVYLVFNVTVVVACNSVAETKDETEGIDTQHLQTLERLKQSQRLEHQKV